MITVIRLLGIALNKTKPLEKKPKSPYVLQRFKPANMYQICMLYKLQIKQKPIKLWLKYALRKAHIIRKCHALKEGNNNKKTQQ